MQMDQNWRSLPSNKSLYNRKGKKKKRRKKKEKAHLGASLEDGNRPCGRRFLYPTSQYVGNLRLSTVKNKTIKILKGT